MVTTRPTIPATSNSPIDALTRFIFCRPDLNTKVRIPATTASVHTRSGGDNPIGELVAGWIEPLDCEVECVVGGEVNPDWVNTP